MNSSVSEASDPSLESPRAITPDKPDTLEADDEDIPATPQLQTAKAATPSLHADDMHASSKDISFRSYKDCYIGTNYMLLIKAMQSGHAEWFWVEEDVIVALVHAWTAYVQSGIYNTSGYTTEAYHEFAARLLRITPARIHAKLAATLSLEPL
ncbi:hypothetical protein Sste5346_008886 [Sporothrix stenoceras]|uniref:Uncharacterized protein n=1 Tax=Sporothrix stenoceras TaxID=5173 RepID=A0ABR3YMG2_9PEZI